MSGQEGRAPQSLLDLEDTGVRYDTYHGSTGLPPGSKSAGEPIQHEQAVQGELGMRKAENRDIEKSRNQQHDQGLGALRSSRITHMTPKVTQGLARQVNAPVKRTGLGEAENVDSDEEQEVHERSPQYFQGFERLAEEHEGVGQRPEPQRITPRRYEREPEDTPKYWQSFSDTGLKKTSKERAMSQLKAKAKAGDQEALLELQALVMSTLMSEMDEESEEEPVESRSGSSRRGAYSEYSPPAPRSSTRSLRLPPPTPIVAPRRPDILKMNIKGIDITSTGNAHNTLYLFQALLQTAGVPEAGVTPEQDADLGMMVTKWVADNAKIVTSLRTTCGASTTGASKLKHVVDVFISPQVKQRDVNPEKKVHEYDYSKLYGGNGTKFHTELQILREMISRLPAEVGGTTTYWINKIERHAGPDILFWVERVMRDDPLKFPPREVRTDFNVFADLMQAAIDTTREYETLHKRPPAAFVHTNPTHTGGGGRGGGNDAERAQDPCPDCKGRLCPKGKAAGSTCDVYGTVSQSRAKAILQIPYYKGFVDRTRVSLSKPPVNYPQPTADEKAKLEAYDAKRANGKGSKGGRGGRGRDGRGRGRVNAHQAAEGEYADEEEEMSTAQQYEAMRSELGLSVH